MEKDDKQTSKLMNATGKHTEQADDSELSYNQLDETVVMDKENVIKTSAANKNKNKATKDTKQKKKVSKEILEIFS